MTTTISEVIAWEALDSRGTPTVACAVRLGEREPVHAVVPSGASTGRHEAVEVRDGGTRYGGRGVRRAVASVEHELARAVVGLDAADQAAVDDALDAADGTESLGRLGANAVLAVSLAVARAAAAALGVPLYRRLDADGPPLLPMPMVNVVSGGAHAAQAIDIQDVLVIPMAASRFSEAIELAWRVRAAAGELARKELGWSGLVADEGGVAVPFASNDLALELVTDAIRHAGLSPGTDVTIAVDVAASELASGSGYRLRSEGRELTADELAERYDSWLERFPLTSIEDPFEQDDWSPARALVARHGARLQIIGDDQFATNARRVTLGGADAANAALIKVNQAGSITRAERALRAAQAAGMATVVSARSGDTEDSWLADLAVGWRAGQIKVGSTTRSERTAKWNRLLAIERLEPAATFARFPFPTQERK